MTIQSDRWIRDQALYHGMIEPFVEAQRREGCISYGLSSYGYDARVADEFKIFTNVDSATVDPKDFAANSFVDRQTDVCIIPPNSFALARTVEYFRVPEDVLVICLGKSTYAPLRDHRERDPARARLGGGMSRWNSPTPRRCPPRSTPMNEGGSHSPNTGNEPRKPTNAPHTAKNMGQKGDTLPKPRSETMVQGRAGAKDDVNPIVEGCASSA